MIGKKYFFILLLLVAFTVFSAENKVVRIVSLYSAYTEILVEIGAKELLVGATRHDAKKLGIISVGNHMNPSIEAIISCRPNFVIAFAKDSTRFDKLHSYLERSNIPLLITAPKSIDEVKTLILKLGKITHCNDSAVAVVKRIENDFRVVDTLLKQNLVTSTEVGLHNL